MKARYPGTCAATGARYEAGTEIARTTDGKGWQLASAPAGTTRTAKRAYGTVHCWECGTLKNRGEDCPGCGEDTDYPGQF